MAQLMTDEQRLSVLEAYNPKEKLIEVAKDKGKPVLYYPAAWRLYELHLRHPHFVLESEIIHMDIEKNLVIVQAIGYDGLDYPSSALKGKALKQGKLSDLDKVETKAKSRVARDVGIGTEYALDMEADETDAQHGTIAPSLVSDARSFVGKVFAFKDHDFDARWEACKVHVLGKPKADPDLSSADVAKIRAYAEQARAKASSGGGR